MEKIIETIKEKSKKFLKKTYAKDLLLLGSLVLIYSIISFINLGATKCPQTYCTFLSGESQILELDKETYLLKARLFPGDIEGKFTLSISSDNVDYKTFATFEDSIISWSDYMINDSAKYIKIYAEKDRKHR